MEYHGGSHLISKSYQHHLSKIILNTKRKPPSSAYNISCLSVRCIKDKPAYFAKTLQKCMKGLGTADSPMIRIIVSRCEADMVQIKKSFEEQFGGTLAQWIKVRLN